MDQNPIPEKGATPVPAQTSPSAPIPNAAPTPAPASIPPPFTLPTSMTSIPSTSAPAPQVSTPIQTPSENPTSNPKKKWVKIGVIAGLAIVLVGALLYFGKSFLFKRDLEEADVGTPKEEEAVIPEAKETPEEEVVVPPEEVIPEAEKLPEEEVEEEEVKPEVLPEEEEPEPDIAKEEMAEEKIVEGEVGTPSEEESAKPEAEKPLEEVSAEGTPEEEPSADVKEISGDGTGVCSDTDYEWGPWSECLNNKQIQSGTNNSCKPTLIYQNRSCSLEEEEPVSPEAGVTEGSADDIADTGSIPETSPEIALAPAEQPTTPVSEVGVGAGPSAPVEGAHVSGGDGGIPQPAPESSGGPQGLDYAGVTVGAEAVSNTIPTASPTPESSAVQISQITPETGATQVATENSQVASTGQSESQDSMQAGAEADQTAQVAQANTGQATSGLHGAYIQGETGPGMLVYPFILAGANALFFLRKKRKSLKR